MATCRPQRSRTPSAARRSFGEPISHTCMPLGRNSAARSAKWLGGQRFAGPYSAPGHRIATRLRRVADAARAIAAARLATSGTSVGAGGIGTSSPRLRPTAPRSGRRAAASPCASACRASFRSRSHRASPPIARAARNAGEPGDQRRLPRVRQHQRARVAGSPDLVPQLRSDPASRREIEPAVTDRILDHCGRRRASAHRPARTTAAPARRRPGSSKGSRSNAISGSDRIASPTHDGATPECARCTAAGGRGSPDEAPARFSGGLRRRPPGDGNVCRNTGSAPGRSRRNGGTRAGATTRAASSGSGSTPAGPSARLHDPAAPVPARWVLQSRERRPGKPVLSA